MAGLEWELVLLVMASAFAAALAAQWIMNRAAPVRRVGWTPLDQMGERCVFLFEDEVLVDATPEARALLRAGPDRLSDWPRLITVLERRFPGCGGDLSALGERQRVVLTSEDRVAGLEAEWRGGLARIALTDAPGSPRGDALDRFGLAALGEELEILRRAAGGAPILIWQEDPAGAVRWANAAYLDLALRRMGAGEALGWPLPRLFDRRPPGGERPDAPRRLPLTLPGTGAPLWFDCATAPADDGGVMVFAIPADRLVRAEASLHEFVQTLTKTFAHLTTGLAVFDRERRLALFNPALTDLSALEPQFLSGRPTLHDFLDRLRERQRMPEPKDYKSWRRRIGEMEAAAATGTHIETWSLPSGQTYRVTGRPHPEGAVAFLFEDISAEISATRRYRSELELGQSVLDSLDEAIVVFSAAGTLILSNRAYDRLWGCETATTLGEIGVTDAARMWQDQCEPTAAWGELREQVQTRQERVEWTARIRRRDGRSLACRMTPIAGNATLVGFAEVADLPPRPRSKLWVAQAPAAAPGPTVPQES